MGVLIVLISMVYGFAAMGYDGILVSIEVDMNNSIPGLEIVGLASNEVKESKERVRIAIRSSGFHWPGMKIFVNLSPADVRKRGAGFDLPIALAILGASDQVDLNLVEVMGLGELQFNGRVRPVKHVLAASSCAVMNNIDKMIVSSENAPEVFALKDINCCVVDDLAELRSRLHFKTREEFETGLEVIAEHDISFDEEINDDAVAKTGKKVLALSDLSFCDALKRAVQVVAAGRHNIHFCGVPGSGKTASAMRIPSLLPALSYEESLEISKIYASCNVYYKSASSQHENEIQGKVRTCNNLIEERPIRMPHHTASVEGIIGSAVKMMPGEISLAHTGVLILDEAPEFKMSILQALREPMDSHEVNISRSGHKWQCLADFQLVLTSNLCPCGNLGKSNTSGQWCLCSEREIFNYWKRIGGAIWDRIDVKFKTKLNTDNKSEPVEDRVRKEKKMYDEVQGAIAIQQERAKKSGIMWNGRYRLMDIDKYSLIDEQCRNVIQKAVLAHGASERGRIIVSRVARTIADLEGSSHVHISHIEEAIALCLELNPSSIHALS